MTAAIVLASGGLDSSVMMMILKEEGIQVSPLHVNYGQRAAEQELKSLKAVCRTIHVGDPEVLDVPGLSRIPSLLTRKTVPANFSSFYPARNLILLSFGAAFAITKRLNQLAIGLLAESEYPDQSEAFVRSAQATIREATGENLTVLAPLIQLDKREVIKIARTRGFPVELTYSCHTGTVPPCGACDGCISLADATVRLESENASHSAYPLAEEEVRTPHGTIG